MTVLCSTTNDLDDLVGVELHDLDAEGRPLPAGVRLTRFLGRGGMSSVFEAQVQHPTPVLLDETPGRVAIKFLLPETSQALKSQGIDPLDFVRREAMSFARIMNDSPPSAHVVAFYGRGECMVQACGTTQRLPWLAIECVDLLPGLGVTLADRLQRERDLRLARSKFANPMAGVLDPVRLRRLVSGVGDGIAAFHRNGVVHRDIKPENVLVVGTPGEEHPKLSDCGIARVEGQISTVGAAGTIAYAGIEQLFAGPAGQGAPPGQKKRNPLVGPATDVHAFAVMVWEMIAGEQWMLDQFAWLAGERRTLRSLVASTAGHGIHPAFLKVPGLLDRLDEVLARAAAFVPPHPFVDGQPSSASPEERTRADDMFAKIHRQGKSTVSRTPRTATVEHFLQGILPLLDEAIRHLTVGPSAPLTEFTRLPSSGMKRTRYVQRALTMLPVRGVNAPTQLSLLPKSTSFRGDGNLIALSHGAIVYFAENQPLVVRPPADPSFQAARVRQVVTIPSVGTILVCDDALWVLRSAGWGLLPLPQRPDAEVGPVQACFPTLDGFCVVTAETEDSGGVEVWKSTDGSSWQAPLTVTFLGDQVNACAAGAFGIVLGGAKSTPKGQRGCAVFLGYDGAEFIYKQPLTSRAGLDVAVAGSGREAWMAGMGGVVMLSAQQAQVELEHTEAAVALALDPEGAVWAVFERSIWRREPLGSAIERLAGGEGGSWRRVHELPAQAAPFVGIGFKGEVPQLVDAAGMRSVLEPG
jgi:hypothetical protein